MIYVVFHVVKNHVMFVEWMDEWMDVTVSHPLEVDVKI